MPAVYQLSVWTELFVEIENVPCLTRKQITWIDEATIKIETFPIINLCSHPIDIFSPLPLLPTQQPPCPACFITKAFWLEKKWYKLPWNIYIWIMTFCIMPCAYFKLIYLPDTFLQKYLLMSILFCKKRLSYIKFYIAE